MKKILSLLLLLTCTVFSVQAQIYNEIDSNGNITQRDESDNKNFNPNNRDSVKNDKIIPHGVWVWTVDRTFGDITPAELDTMPHLYQNSIYSTGVYGEYNTIGNNFSSRLSRIFIDRPVISNFYFTDSYDYMHN